MTLHNQRAVSTGEPPCCQMLNIHWTEQDNSQYRKISSDHKIEALRQKHRHIWLYYGSRSSLSFQSNSTFYLTEQSTILRKLTNATDLKKILFLAIQTNFVLVSIKLKRGIQLNLRMSYPLNIHFPTNYVAIRLDIRIQGSKTTTVTKSISAVEICIGRLW